MGQACLSLDVDEQKAGRVAVLFRGVIFRGKNQAKPRGMLEEAESGAVV